MNEIKFDLDGDILYEIAMELFWEHNSHIAGINDHLGDIYSYSDLKDAEEAEMRDEIGLLHQAVKQLQDDRRNIINYLKYFKDHKNYSNFIGQTGDYPVAAWIDAYDNLLDKINHQDYEFQMNIYSEGGEKNEK